MAGGHSTVEEGITAAWLWAGDNPLAASTKDL
jgi:hypothetical protein